MDIFNGAFENDFAAIEIWEETIERLSRQITNKRGIPISTSQICAAVEIIASDKPDWDFPTYRIGNIPNYDALLNTLLAYDFYANSIKVTTGTDGIGISLVQTKVIIKNRGIVWVVHKTDADPFPSNPHAHNIDNGLKLHLGNGLVYRKKKEVGKIKEKELLEIRNVILSKGIELPALLI